MLIVSRCLTGEPCRYDGRDNLVPELRDLAEAGKAAAVCPEVLGGLPTPRTPSERTADGRVIARDGADVTEAFCLGAERAMEICRESGCTGAVLKSRSPSCGCGEIYDGSFTGTRVPGCGVFAQRLLDVGVSVMTEEDWRESRGVWLETVSEENWRLGLRVAPEQEKFVSGSDRLLARAYACRERNSRAFVIRHGAEAVGMALYYDCPELEAYDLSQLFIDARYQGKGYGLAAAKLLLAEMARAERYGRVMLCYIEGNETARRFWEELDFVPTGERDGDEIVMERRLPRRTLAFCRDEELLGRMKRLLERRAARADTGEEIAWEQRLCDAALLLLAREAKKLWPEVDTAAAERAMRFAGDEERERLIALAARLIGGRLIDKPEDLSYWLSAETLAERYREEETK